MLLLTNLYITIYFKYFGDYLRQIKDHLSLLIENLQGTCMSEGALFFCIQCSVSCNFGSKQEMEHIAMYVFRQADCTYTSIASK